MSEAKSPLRHIFAHAALANVTADQHHLTPRNISVSNTTQVIPPLPGGPGIWDIALPFEANVVRFAFRSGWQTNDVGGKAGVHGIATRVAYLEAVSFSFASPVTWIDGSYIGVFSKPASALELSHRVFTTSGWFVSLTDAYIATTGPTTRVLRTSWTNYGASNYTLTAYGEIEVIG